MAADLDVYHVYLLRRPDGTPLRAYESYDACQRDLGDALRLFGDGYTTTGVPFTPSAPPLAAPAPGATMATGEAHATLTEAKTALMMCGRILTNMEPFRRFHKDAIDAALHNLDLLLATPPAAPAAVTVTDAQVDAAQAEWKRAVYDEPPADGDVHRQAWKRAIAAAAAAEPVEGKS